MSAVISRSDRPEQRACPGAARALGAMRVAGGVDVRAEVRGGKSRVTHLRERDGFKVRFARRASPPEGVIINTGGGLASGDAIRQTFDVGKDAELTMTTQAAERCYRSGDGATTSIDVAATVNDNAVLNWLPQETIIYDEARLSRSIDVSLAPTARLLMSETVVFGRRAMGEILRGGLFTDRWRIVRDGKLIFAENARVGDDVFDDFTASAITGGAHAAVTLLLASGDGEERLARAQSVTDAAPFKCAASAWHGKLVVRGLAERAQDVRHLMHVLVPALGGPPMPRSWLT